MYKLQVGNIFEWKSKDRLNGLRVLIADIHSRRVFAKIIVSKNNTYKTNQILDWPASVFLDKQWVLISNSMYERWHEIMKQE